MITQDFLLEYEMTLLKAYNRASHSMTNETSKDANYLSQSKKREHFVKEFMLAFREQEVMLSKEILKGGHPDAAKLLQKIGQDVESKLRSAFYGKENLDRPAFQKVLRDLKTDVRSVFYERYLSQ